MPTGLSWVLRNGSLREKINLLIDKAILNCNKRHTYLAMAWLEKTVSQYSFCGRKQLFILEKKGKVNSSTSCFADVNECATGKHNCNGSSICHNTKGSFLCICREPGYFWNGVNCRGKYLLYIEIVDSSDKKGHCVIGVCHMMKSVSLSLSLISRLFPLFRV